MGLMLFKYFTKVNHIKINIFSRPKIIRIAELSYPDDEFEKAVATEFAAECLRAALLAL